MLWLLGLALAQAPDIEAAVERQQDIPALLAREGTAQARLADAEAFLAGELLLEEAWPEWADAPLNDPAWMAGQLARLDAQGAARAAERMVGGPEELKGVLTAEQAADDAERELLLRLRALVEVHPRLSAPALLTYRAELAADREAATLAWEEDPAQALDIAVVDERIQKLDDTVRRALLFAARGDAVDAEPCVDEHAARRLELIAGISPEALAELQAWEAPQSAAPESAEAARELAAARRLWLETAHPALQDWLSAEVEHLDALVEARELEEAETLIDTTVEEAELRRLEAEEAVAQAQDLDERRRLQQLAAAAEAEQRAATAVQDHQERKNELAEAREEKTKALDDLAEQSQAIVKARKSLAGDRDERAESTYRELRSFIVTLRGLVEQAEGDQDVAEAAAAALTEEFEPLRLHLSRDQRKAEGDAEVLDALGRHEGALDALVLNAQDRVDEEESHRAAMLVLLHEAKTERRRLRPEVPREVVLEDDVLGDALYELSLLADNLWSLSRERVNTVLTLPQKLMDLSAITGFLAGAFWVIVGLLAWRFARPRASLPVRSIIARIAEQRPAAYRRELTALAAPAEPVVVALVDGLAVVLLVGPAMEVVPEVGLVLLVWLQVAVYRLLLGLYDLLVGRGAGRLALVVLSPDAWDLGRKTVRWLLLWAIVRQFLGRALLAILFADALHQLLIVLFNLVLVVLALRLLHEWEPVLRARVRREGTDNSLRAYLASEPRRPRLTRFYRAMIGFVVLGAAWAWRFVQGQARAGSALARLLNIFYRYSLSSSDAETEDAGFLAPLPKELDEALRAKGCGEGFVRRTEMDEQFWSAVRRWEKEHRHGTVALAADRGAGRSTWLNRTCAELAEEGHMVARFRLNERCLDAASLCRTLSKNLGLGEIDNVDALEAALDARPSGFIVVEEAHLSFLRRVGGLEGVSTLLEILGRTHDRHFWVVTFHLPAWYYLSRLGGLLKVHIFQHRLELPPMPEGALRELLVRRTEEAGYTLDYLRLVRRGTLSGDALGELEHSTTAFYRVLREASYGNPSIAAELWRDCVHADPAKKMLYVRMAPALSEGRIEDLGEAELFTLAALRMQGGLTEKELVQVNNMRPGAVRASLQILRARDLIERNERGFRVRARQQATVTRTLQYRHFLDWRTTHGI